jgi:D-alanyl-D-alanine carboxypeptidase/D-alanyl-D-alanine-endopeptidase (penicillin-binding protein 4)
MALPMAGVDGTLRERMKKGPANGWVRAKTGLLTGVVALAGFAGRPDGTVFTFVFIFNGTGEQTWAARDTLDVLASALVMGK